MPYIAHLLGVTGIVLEYGGDETEAIGALLHDAAEDAGGQNRLEDIRNRFGDAVAEIVAGCTDSDVIPRPPWRVRKETYLDHLHEALPSVLLVSAADKLHNARALLRTYLDQGDEIFERYSGAKDGTLWYYRSLAKVFDSIRPTPLTEDLKRVVAEIEKLAST